MIYLRLMYHSVYLSIHPPCIYSYNYLYTIITRFYAWDIFKQVSNVDGSVSKERIVNIECCFSNASSQDSTHS